MEYMGTKPFCPHCNAVLTNYNDHTKTWQCPECKRDYVVTIKHKKYKPRKTDEPKEFRSSP